MMKVLEKHLGREGAAISETTMPKSISPALLLSSVTSSRTCQIIPFFASLEVTNPVNNLRGITKWLMYPKAWPDDILRQTGATFRTHLKNRAGKNSVMSPCKDLGSFYFYFDIPSSHLQSNSLKTSPPDLQSAHPNSFRS